MFSKKKIPTLNEIRLEFNGKTYRAYYYVESEMVTVKAISRDGGNVEKTTQIGGSTAAHVARMLLREIIEEVPGIESLR